MSGGIIAAGIVRARRRIERDFADASATSPERAIAYAPGGSLLAHRVFARMRAHGAVVETAPGSFYLDQAGLDAYRTARRTRVAAVLAVAAAGVAAVLALG